MYSSLHALGMESCIRYYLNGRKVLAVECNWSV
jgi:hypothetical protein